MPYTGLTPTTTINGVDFLTASVFNATATIADEVLHLDGATQLYGSLTVQRSQISSTSTRSSTGDNRAGTAILNAVSASQSSLSIESFSNEHSFYLDSFTDSIFIETGLKHRVLVFTNPNASIQNATFIAFYWMEVNGSFSSFANVSFIDSVLGILNWLAGRLDLTGINIPSTTSGYYCALGQGANNNKFFFWNPVALDFSKVLHTSAEHRAYKGFTVSWQFSDTSGGISNTLVIYRDDRTNIGGSKTELGRYLTNSSGVLAGSYDSKQGVTGSNVERPSLWILTQQSAPTGAIVAQSPPNTFYTGQQVNGSYVDHLYDVQDILVEIEVRSYLHSAPDLIGAPTAEIGRINPDESVNFYRPFPLLVDEGVTITNTTTVSGYSGIAHATTGFSLSGTLTLSQVYDSRKLYWRNNDGVSVPNKVGSVADFGAANITIASPTANPATTAKYDRATHTGTLTLSAAGSYSARPWDVPAVGIVTVASGSTNLQGWAFIAGATINVSSGTAIVTVDDTTGITAGTGVTLQTPQASLTVPAFEDGTRFYAARYQTFLVAASGISTGANTIALGHDLETGAAFAGQITTPATLAYVLLASGATLPTSSPQLQSGNLYYVSANSSGVVQLSESEGGTALDFSAAGTNNGTGQTLIIVCTTQLINQIVSGGSGVTQALALPNNAKIEIAAQNVASDEATATTLFSRVIAWNNTTGATIADTFSLANNPDPIYNELIGATITSKRGLAVTVTSVPSTVAGLSFDLSGNIELDANAIVDALIPAPDAYVWMIYQRYTQTGIRFIRNQLIALSIMEIDLTGQLRIDNTADGVRNSPATPLVILGNVYTAEGAEMYAPNTGTVRIEPFFVSDLTSAGDGSFTSDDRATLNAISAKPSIDV